MHSFRIRPDGFKDARKRMLLWTIPAVILGLGVGSMSVWVNTDTRSSAVKPAYVTDYANDPLDYIVYLPIVVFIAVLGFGMYRGLKRMKKLFGSYELSITDNLISREQLNTPTISIYINEVQEIVKRRRGGYFIKGEKASDLIIVPKQIEDPEQLEQVLEKIKPIASKGKGLTQLKLQAYLTLVSLGLLICVNVTENKVIVALAGTLFIAITIYNFIQTLKSKNVDYRTKRNRWVSLLAVLFVIFVMIMKLTNYSFF
jgi:hypothetical protein